MKKYQEDIWRQLRLYEINKTLETQHEKKNLKKIMLSECHKFLSMFEKAVADKLPFH